jgi:transmembrane protein 17
LSLLLQLPLVLFLLLNEATIITPIERSVTIILTAFVLLEVLIGYFAIRTMVNSQVNKFHLQQFTDLEQIDDTYEAEESPSVRRRGVTMHNG